MNIKSNRVKNVRQNLTYKNGLHAYKTGQQGFCFPAVPYARIASSQSVIACRAVIHATDRRNRRRVPLPLTGLTASGSIRRASILHLPHAFRRADRHVHMYAFDDEDSLEQRFIVRPEEGVSLAVIVMVDKLDDEDMSMARDDAISAVLDTLTWLG